MLQSLRRILSMGDISPGSPRPHESRADQSRPVEASSYGSRIRPPAHDAVKAALEILLSSVTAENAETGLTSQHTTEMKRVVCKALLEEAQVEPSEILLLQHNTADLTDSAAFRRKLASQAAQLHYLQNTTVAINRLPPEIFAMILRASLPEGATHIDSRITILQKLAAVAKIWRKAVLNTPQLWSILHVSYSAQEVDWSLRLSKGAVLDVAAPRSRSYQVKSGDPDFIPKVIRHSGRWRTILARYSPEIGTALESHSPLLQNIGLETTHNKDGNPVSLSEGAEVRVLTLAGVGLRWCSPRLRGLTHLGLEGLSLNHAPSVSQLLAILDASPKLSNLTIQAVKLKPDDSSGNQGRRLIELPAIRRLKVQGVSNGAYSQLLSNITCPNATHVWLAPVRLTDWHSPEADPTALSIDHTAPSFVQTVKRAFRADEHMDFMFERDVITLASHERWLKRHNGWRNWGEREVNPEDLPGLHMAFRTAEVNATIIASMTSQMAQLIKALDPAATVDLHLVGPGFPVGCIGEFSGARRIDIGSSCGPGIIQRLGTKVAGEGSWPCPHVTHLNLREMPFSPVADIRNWVDDRWVKYKPEVEGHPGTYVEVALPRGGKLDYWRTVKQDGDEDE